MENNTWIWMLSQGVPLFLLIVLAFALFEYSQVDKVVLFTVKCTLVSISFAIWATHGKIVSCADAWFVLYFVAGAALEWAQVDEVSLFAVKFALIGVSFTIGTANGGIVSWADTWLSFKGNSRFHSWGEESRRKQFI